MAHILAARVAATSTSSGTDSFLITGGMVAHRPFSAVLQTGDTTEYLAYAAVDGMATGQWEAGMCEYFGPEDAGGERIERLSPMENSIKTYSDVGGLPRLDFAAGTKVVILTPTAERLSYIPRGGETGQVLNMTDDGAAWAGLVTVPEGGLNLYVRPDGNNENDGLEDTAGRAFLMVSRAIKEAMKYNLGGLYEVVIHVADGDYTTTDYASVRPPELPDINERRGNINIIGNEGTPANVLLPGAGFLAEKLNVFVTGVSFRSSGQATNIQLSKCVLGRAGGVNVNNTTWLELLGGDSSLSDCTFSGGARCFVLASTRAEVSIFGTQYADSAYAEDYILYADNRSMISVFPEGDSGTITGKKYVAERMSMINTAGVGDDDLAGSLPGELLGGSVLV